MSLPARDDSVQPACPLPERMPTEFELLKQELEIERKRNLDQDSSYQAKLGQYKYFLKIQEDKVKDERNENYCSRTSRNWALRIEDSKMI